MGAVLIVDDEPRVREGLVRAVESRGHHAIAADGLQNARALLARESFDCVLLDLRLADGDGLELLRAIREGLGGQPPVIVATAYTGSDRAIDAMRVGAFEYVTKPFDLPILLDAVARAVRKHGLATAASEVGEPVVSSRVGSEPTTLVGASAAMLGVWKMIGRAAASDAPVLICGETGTGKEVVARALHEHSSRASGPWVAVNLASLPPTLIESELMGHEKGAFTGAHRRREGRIELAAGGTLFLDEIGDLDFALQTKLLRVLADGTYERVGGSETLKSSARVIAATNKEVRPGKPGVTLREDLYYRLAAIEIELPPLRRRRSDVPLLVAHARKRTQARAVTEEAMEKLVAYAWPGNVRELNHVIERAALVCGAEVIDVTDLPPALREVSPPSSRRAVDPYEGMPLRNALAAFEKQLILKAIEKAKGNRAEAARILGIARPQLYAKMAEHELPVANKGRLPD